MFSAGDIAENFVSRMLTLLIFKLYCLKNCEKYNNTNDTIARVNSEIQALYNEYIHAAKPVNSLEEYSS